MEDILFAMSGINRIRNAAIEYGMQHRLSEDVRSAFSELMFKLDVFESNAPEIIEKGAKEHWTTAQKILKDFWTKSASVPAVDTRSLTEALIKDLRIREAANDVVNKFKEELDEIKNKLIRFSAEDNINGRYSEWIAHYNEMKTKLSQAEELAKKRGVKDDFSNVRVIADDIYEVGKIDME